ncbi:hypothetical protein [Ensifer soli]|uniref:hypothetical protein n=1 Tax=Ciceribacter sp. sgz301302 TaxID=3342379 RepID=UPI0035B725D1
MRHRRSIDLAAGTPVPSADIHVIGKCAELAWLTCAKLSPDYVLGGECAACGHIAWLDRWKLALRFGENVYLENLRPRLQCMSCGNRNGNGFVIGKSA